MKTKQQLELFAARDSDEIHALGLLGWKDPLWTTRISIPLLGGSRLFLRLIDVRALQELCRRKTPDPPTSSQTDAKDVSAGASGAEP